MFLVLICRLMNFGLFGDGIMSRSKCANSVAQFRLLPPPLRQPSGAAEAVPRRRMRRALETNEAFSKTSQALMNARLHVCF
jgi:hypothetical protein